MITPIGLNYDENSCSLKLESPYLAAFRALSNQVHSFQLTQLLQRRKLIMPIRLLMTAALAVCFSATLFSQTKLLRFPDIYGDRVVFTYGGDLWTVSSAG